jgi:hypothetical protein
VAGEGNSTALRLIGDIADRAIWALLGGLVSRAFAAQQGRHSVRFDRAGALPPLRSSRPRPTPPAGIGRAAVSVAGLGPRAGR